MSKTIALFLTLLFITALFVSAVPAACADEANKAFEGAVVIPAKDASFTEGKGVSFENKKTATAYDAEHGMIVNIARDGEITFTVPEGVDGSFDVYLTVSKVMTQFTSQYFAFSINGEEPWSVPLDCQVSADALAKDDRDGAEYNTGTIYDDGRFLIAENVALKTGDTIKLLATYGAKAANLKGATFPGLMEVTLAPAGSEVAVGYDYTVPEKQEIDPEDPLSGKTILWIGSSVTYGASSEKESMVDFLAARHGAVCVKEAVSGTTLASPNSALRAARSTCSLTQYRAGARSAWPVSAMAKVTLMGPGVRARIFSASSRTASLAARRYSLRWGVASSGGGSGPSGSASSPVAPLYAESIACTAGESGDMRNGSLSCSMTKNASAPVATSCTRFSIRSAVVVVG